MDIFKKNIANAQIGLKGQRILQNSSCLLIGLGGLGSPTALYLSAAGLGQLVLVDPDQVQESNLNRQILYTQRDLGRAKVDIAQEKLRAHNPHIKIISHKEQLTAQNASALIERCDLVLDCTDRLASRLLINDSCRQESKPLLQGAVNGFWGQVFLCFPHRGPCLRCLYPQIADFPQKEAEQGVLGATTGVVGSYLALTACQYLLGRWSEGLLRVIDTWNQQEQTVSITPRPKCPCQTNKTTVQGDGNP